MPAKLSQSREAVAMRDLRARRKAEAEAAARAAVEERRRPVPLPGDVAPSATLPDLAAAYGRALARGEITPQGAEAVAGALAALGAVREPLTL